MKKFIIRLFVFLTFFFFWSYYRLDGFQLSKVKVDSSGKTNATVTGFEDVKSVLDQKFFYLAKGRQCFVFESEDGNYVIKLLNHQRFELPWQIKRLNFIPYLKQLEHKRSLRKKPSLESYRIAYDFLKEETAILFVKMGNENSFHQIISLKDKAGNKHKIDLCNVDLILQQKACPIYPYLTKLYKEDKAKFKNAIYSLLEIVSSRICKNIIDDDLDIQINYGFLDGRAILIDPGRLHTDTSLFNLSNQKIEMVKSTKKLRKWIEKEFPEMVSFFDSALLLKLGF